MQIAWEVEIFLSQMRLGGEDYLQPCLRRSSGKQGFTRRTVCKRRGDKEDLKQPVYQDRVRVLRPEYKMSL